MAAACTAATAAAPPLLLTPRRLNAIERQTWGRKKPDRASSSESWTRDKLLARASSSIPGRASLSENWTKDKVERAGRSPSRETTRIGCKRSPSRAPSADRTEKKARPKDNGADSAAYYYAGPAFIKSPDPSELPVPAFIKSPDPSEVPVPRFLKAADNN
ncbi:uncharacterized protein LOC133912709 [Phragmites australis]|uniref:uncharacterized protein LOC133912709 n=1 Tax=Phragmites australis TaxID=29695 RepID=UPI002D77D9C7|nr:uncharacterized protein LOC133912709 [Phragmites australis]